MTAEEKKKKQPPLKTFKQKNWQLRVYANEKSGKLFYLSKFFKSGTGFKNMQVSFMPREVPTILNLFEEFRQWNLQEKNKGAEGAKEVKNEEPKGEEVPEVEESEEPYEYSGGEDE